MRSVAALLFLVSLPLATFAQSPAAGVRPEIATSGDCGDFLAEMHRKPDHAIYVGCSYVPDRQGKPLQARYRVSGRFAAGVEAYLIREVRLSRLKRSCCVWDAPPSQFRDEKGREFSISMGSGENLGGRSRGDWHQIEAFEILVETFTEEI